MKRWQGPLWAAGGAGLLAVVLYGAGWRDTRPTSDRNAADPGEASVEGKAPQVGVVTLDAETRQRLGIVTAALATGTDRPTVEGFARGLDVAPLAAILAEVDAAQAAVEASTAEAARVENLFAQDTSASRRSVEAARAQQRADTARLRLAEQRIAIEFGPGLARLGSAGVRELVGTIAKGEAALIRIDIPGARLESGDRVSLGPEAAAAEVRVLGPAASTDARLQSAGVLAALHGPLARQSLAGRIMPAQVATGTGRSGLLVPSSAILRFQGLRWVYRQDGERFMRVALPDAVSLDGGWLINAASDAAAIKPGDRVVVQGATGLMALDLAASGQAQTAMDED